MTTEWALVPKKQDIDMDIAWREVWYSKRRCIDDADTQDCYDAMIQASPGAALLAEVLAARDAWFAAGIGSPCEDAATIRLFDALDKLGPAQPCQPGEHHE